MKVIVFFVIILCIISCGLPDVTGITQDLNQPFIIKIIPGNNKLTVEFEAQNNEPAFSGYNIYFGDKTNPRKYRLYNQQKSLPTISAELSEYIKKYIFEIQIGQYASKDGGEINTLTINDLNNGIPIYIFVSSYQIAPSLESYYYYDNFVQMGTPRPEELEKDISVNDDIRIGDRILTRLINQNNQLYFQNSNNRSMLIISGNSLDDIVIPPENGYGNMNLEVKANRLYLIKISENNNNYYAKIFIRRVINTSNIIADYCLQTSANILSY